MSTSVYTGLNTFNFIRKHFLQIACEMFLMYAVIAAFNSLSVKAVPLQAWSGPEGSSKLRFPDFLTTAQDGGKVVSLTHRLHLPPGNTSGTQ
jgi:hypothetical protein